MAIVLCLTCGSLSWVIAWLLLGGGEYRREMMAARLHAIESLLRRWLAAMANGAPMRAMRPWKPFSQAARDLSSAMREHGVVVHANEAEAIVLVSLPTSALLGLLLSRSAVGALIFPLGLCALMAMRHAARVRRRTKRMAEEMPGVLRTLANALESGQTLVQALEYVGLHERGPAADSFSRTSLRLRCGMSVEAALEELTHELDAPGVGLMVTALAISQRTGSPLRDLLRRTAGLVEQQREFERLLRVRTAQVRLSVRIVCVMPLAMVCLLSLISPDFRQGALSSAGMVCLLLAATMDALALLLIRKIMGGVL
ncbi:MAG: type II secretion system F family protein [Atopobiaceae bacterium]|nr:type II secretion system F family protein [Atopobiaceae bacterium]